MPIYEYRCQECGATFDRFVRSFANAATVEVECPHCRSKRCQKNISLFGTSGSGNSTESCAPSG
jgi:putative FmdB family regulatory protein